MIKNNIKLCECGCGQQIKIQFHHKYYGIPKFISGHNKAHKGFICSKESKRKMSIAHVGQNLSEIHKKYCTCFICKAKRGEGRPCEQNTKDKISIANSGANNGMHGTTGNKCPAWKGGLSFIEYGTTFTKQLKEQIRDKFGRLCFICGTDEEELKTKLDIHHIDYNKKNNAITNLVSLCKKCHAKTNWDRSYWKGKITYDLVHRGYSLSSCKKY